jgi:hypothetical protein
VDAVLLLQFFVGQVFWGRLLDRLEYVSNVSCVCLVLESSRRFLFQTWLGSGPPPGRAPGPDFDKESRKLLVVLATKRGRELWTGVPNGVPEDEEGAAAY